ncbi:MAG: DUF1456 family protein [Candidatus Cloacimonetes bacterium]|nr:DUF1456 family protein [Candidatus Cloacimonadota bacterium]
MHNNDIFRRIRYIFDFSDTQMMEIFAHAERPASRAEISDWLKRDDDPNFKQIPDRDLAQFLNGLIIKNRGKRDGALPEPEERLNNNIVFIKLKIALNMKAEDILEVLSLANFTLGKSELSSFFRKKGARQYRSCQDQVLRNFFMGLQKKYHVEKPVEEEKTTT